MGNDRANGRVVEGRKVYKNVVRYCRCGGDGDGRKTRPEKEANRRWSGGVKRRQVSRRVIRIWFFHAFSPFQLFTASSRAIQTKIRRTKSVCPPQTLPLFVSVNQWFISTRNPNTSAHDTTDRRTSNGKNYENEDRRYIFVLTFGTAVTICTAFRRFLNRQALYLRNKTNAEKVWKNVMRKVLSFRIILHHKISI